VIQGLFSEIRGMCFAAMRHADMENSDLIVAIDVTRSNEARFGECFRSKRVGIVIATSLATTCSTNPRF
jgi:hypothetical protein